MPKGPGVKVYVLGAGCSLHCGYPLAASFLEHLDRLWLDLIGPHVEKIRRAVGNTVELLRQRSYPTIDELVEAINNRVLDDPSADFRTKQQLRDERVYEAKVATAGLFFRLEGDARKTGLPRYSEFLKEVLGDDDWQMALQESNCRVLTFNYDRLFEIAFLRRFGVDTAQYPLYGQTVLNSGLGVMERNNVSFKPNRFCYLKLHGSVELRARDEYGEPHHYYSCDSPVRDCLMLKDDYFFGLDGKPDPRNPRLEPLILFPFEKRFVAKQPKNGFPYRTYIQKIWDQALAVLKEATEIWVIGYSFATTDREAFLSLLSHANPTCRRIVIQNPDAESICRTLRAKYPDLTIPIEPLTAAF